MTDLHTHILPGIDDGAIDEGVSSEQMKSLLEQGVDKVVFTSHYYGRKRSPKQFLEARADAFGRIKDLIPEGMETYLGAEVHFAAEMAASDESICAMAIGDTRYILAELPFAAFGGLYFLDGLYSRHRACRALRRGEKKARVAVRARGHGVSVAGKYAGISQKGRQHDGVCAARTRARPLSRNGHA